jgi:hypothetical protein
MTPSATVLAAIFGRPKLKKTSDALAAFPTALCIGVPSALRLVAENELGFTPRLHPNPPQILPDLIRMLSNLADSGRATEYGAIIIDDASHICRRSMLHWNEVSPTGRSGKKDKFWAYQELSRHLLHLAGLGRHLGVHMALTFHERAGGMNADGTYCPGGPDVPSRNQTEVIPSWCDITVRAMVDQNYPDPWFPTIYYTNPADSDWVTGDRNGVCYERTPGNLREILNASATDYALCRLEGLEWQDDIAEQVASAIASGQPAREAVQQVAATIQGADPRHLRWACQDGIARGVLRLRQAKSLFDFGAREEVTTAPAGALLPPPPPTSS